MKQYGLKGKMVIRKGNKTYTINSALNEITDGIVKKMNSKIKK